MKKIFALILSTFLLFTSFNFVFAAEDTITVSTCAQGENVTGVSFDFLCNLSLNGGVISRAITIALVVAAFIALAFLIIGGIRWILSGGEKEKVEEARGTIIASLVGLIIAFLAYFLINIVFGIFGIGKVGDINSVPLLNVFSSPCDQAKKCAKTTKDASGKTLYSHPICQENGTWDCHWKYNP